MGCLHALPGRYSCCEVTQNIALLPGNFSHPAVIFGEMTDLENRGARKRIWRRFVQVAQKDVNRFLVPANVQQQVHHYLSRGCAAPFFRIAPLQLILEMTNMVLYIDAAQRLDVVTVIDKRLLERWLSG